jgi:hypothetical protein
MAGADRSRLYRARQRKGRAVYRVEASDDVLFALVQAQRTTDGDLRDRRAIERELTRVLAEWAARWR